MPSPIDLFIIAAEPSADLHGANLIQSLLTRHPNLQIGAIAGPLMRKLPIQTVFPMENFQVMGFIDVIKALPKLIFYFFCVRKKILNLNPKAVVSIDYPGFNLRLAASLKKKGYSGKLIHYICPSVWAWGKGRIPQMAKTLDLLLTIFPFEKNFFDKTPLKVEYTGHPLTAQIPSSAYQEELKNREFGKQDLHLLAIFPGSRKSEILRNFPIQLAAASILVKKIPNLKIGISIAHPLLAPLIYSLSKNYPASLLFYNPNQKSELMLTAKAAIATSGTVTLELALYNVPSVVNFAISPLDLFIAQKIFRINLPFYCIVNIILSRRVFTELFGPRLTADSLAGKLYKLWTEEQEYSDTQKGCKEMRDALGSNHGADIAAQAILLSTFKSFFQ